MKNVSCYSREGVKLLDNVSFEAFSGEILGIAGIAGSGQKELLEAISGLQPVTPESEITYYDPETDKPMSLIGKSVKAIRKLGVSLSFVPEDRLGMGLVGSMGMNRKHDVKELYRRFSVLYGQASRPKNLPKKLWRISKS